MAGEADKDLWTRLGEMLERRRVEMDTRYANLKLFTDERGLDYRLAWDIEHGRRDNYRRTTLAAIEQAYNLEPWSIDGFLRAGIPLAAADLNPYADDPDLAEVWAQSQGLRPDVRHGIVALSRKMRDGKGNGRHSGGEDQAGGRLRRA